MTKRQLIDRIITINRTARPAFLAKFTDADLDAYLRHLQVLQTPRVRLTGDPSRYEEYFRGCPVIPASRGARAARAAADPPEGPSPDQTPRAAEVELAREPAGAVAAIDDEFVDPVNDELAEGDFPECAQGTEDPVQDEYQDEQEPDHADAEDGLEDEAEDQEDDSDERVDAGNIEDAGEHHPQGGDDDPPRERALLGVTAEADASKKPSSFAEEEDIESWLY